MELLSYLIGYNKGLEDGGDAPSDNEKLIRFTSEHLVTCPQFEPDWGKFYKLQDAALTADELTRALILNKYNEFNYQYIQITPDMVYSEDGLIFLMPVSGMIEDVFIISALNDYYEEGELLIPRGIYFRETFLDYEDWIVIY